MIGWLIAARFVHYSTLTFAFGGFAYGAFAADERSARRRLRLLAFWSGMGAVVSAAAVLFATVAGLGGGYAATLDGSLWSAVVAETDFGRVWVVRILLATALTAVAAVAVARPAMRLRPAGLLLASALLATIALTGHAQIEEGAAGLLHRAADAAHLLAAAAWIGVLPPLLLLLRKTAPGRVVARPDAAARRLRSFHAVGVAAVLVLAATGAINGWFLVGSVDRLATTPYGRLLLLKLALFAGMIALAADNRLRLLPALSRSLARGAASERALHRLRGHIRGELILALLVLLIVAALGAIAPADAG